MREMENDIVCKALRKFFADVRYVTPNKVNKQDPTATPTDFRPVGIGCNWYRIANKPLANEAAGRQTNEYTYSVRPKFKLINFGRRENKNFAHRNRKTTRGSP